MTLIAQLFIRGAPIIVGDILLSTDVRTGLRTDLPLVGNINQLLAERGLSFEVGFAQKVNILSDRLVVAWSGPVDEAERALRILSAVASRHDLTRADIETELLSIDPDRISRLHLIGLLVTDVHGHQVSASSFQIRSSRVDVPGLGAVYAAGTGKNAFLRLLEGTDWTLAGDANVSLVAYSLVGELIDKELRRGGTIAEKWGGGFEAVTFRTDLGRFQKVGEVLHTFWSVDLSVPGEAQFTPWFYKTSYLRDALVVRYVRFNKIADRTFQVAMNSFELIPPLLRSKTDYDLDEPNAVDFSHEVLCCHVSVKWSGGSGGMQLVLPKPAETIDLKFSGKVSGRLQIPASLTKMVTENARIKASGLLNV